jgi:glycosyltransferase involved in cell wall biosynthesis
MNIVFLLPSSGHEPIGGFKIVYQYADGLVGRGHNVTVVHPSFLPSGPSTCETKVRRFGLSFVKQLLTGRWKPKNWFKFRNDVRLSWVPALNPLFLPKADVYVSTWWRTAELLAGWRLRGQRIYLIQHYETWGGPEDRVKATWRAPLKKIVISRWLKTIADSMGETTDYIPNGMDTEQFACDIPQSARNATRLGMLYHSSDWKGSADGLAAVEIVRESFPTLEMDLFGVPAEPENLPEWIHYHRQPTQSQLRALYNRVAIFVAPSWAEGWSLPPAEAMMCGAAVVATDIGGHQEFCFDYKTALLSPMKCPEALASKIVELISDDALRIKISSGGMSNISKHTWDVALARFENVIGSSSGKGA